MIWLESFDISSLWHKEGRKSSLKKHILKKRLCLIPNERRKNVKRSGKIVQIQKLRYDENWFFDELLSSVFLSSLGDSN